MPIICRFALLSIVALVLARPAQAQVLYGAGPAPNSDPSIAQPSYLYEIDPATAQVTPIGPIGFSSVRGMDVDPITGAIYATAFRPTGGVSGDVVLLTINAATGQGTELMSWPSSNAGSSSRVAVRPSDGAIFVGWAGGGFARAEPQSNNLTSVPGVPSLFATTFDFRADGRLWWIYSEGNIFWRDLATGASGPAGDVFVGCCGLTVDSLSLQPNTGTAFVAGANQADSTREQLYTLNLETGELNQIGTFHPEGGAVNYHLDIDALAWSEGPAASPTPISRWRAENDAVDSVNGNDGTMENGATFAPGVAGVAFSFDGMDDQVTVPHNDNLNVRTQVTISAWVNTLSAGHGRPIAQKRSSGNVGGFTFETTGAPYGADFGLQWIIWINGAARTLQTPPAVLQPGLWQHVAATFDGTTMRIFVDGVERAAMAAAGAIDIPPPGPFVIGRNVVIPSFAWHGFIDELEIYGQTLSSAQIRAIFDSGGSAGPTATSVAVSATPSVFGGSTDLSAVVSPSGAPGSVVFYVNDGATPIAATYNQATGAAIAPGYVHGLAARVSPYNVRAVFASGSAAFTGSEVIAGVLTVARASQTITFGALVDKIVGAPDFPVTAAASSGLPVTFSIVSGPATVPGNVVHLTGGGVVTVRASQSGRDRYNPAPNVDRSFTVTAAATTIGVFLHGSGATANPPTLFLDATSPPDAAADYKDSAAVSFSGGNAWRDVGSWGITPRSLARGNLTSLGALRIWLGLRSSADQGALFDVRADVLRNGSLVASGLSRCIQGLTPDENQAQEITVAFGAFAPTSFNGTTDNLVLRMSARIGTTANNTSCGSRNGASGLRSYFDAVNRPARFGATFRPTTVETPRARLLINKAPDQVLYGRGAPILINTLLIDAGGHIVPDAAVELVSDPPADSRNGNTFAYLRDGIYTITATAAGAGGTGPLAASIQIEVNGHGEAISCADPLDGAMLNRAPGQITLTGSVNTFNGVTAFSVNGTPVAVGTAGAFSTAIDAAWGVNFIDLALVDGTGRQTRRTCAFLLADTWAPDTQKLSHTTSLKLRQSAIDDGVRSLNVNSFADILHSAVNGAEVGNTLHTALLGANPLKPSSCDSRVLGVCLISSQVIYTSSQLRGPNTVLLGLVNGGLTGSASFFNPQVRLRVNGHVAGLPYDMTINVNIQSVAVGFIFNTSVDGAGRPNVSVRPNSVAASVGSITINFGGRLNNVVAGIVSSLANGVIRDIVRGVLVGFVQNRFTAVLDDLMSGLDAQSVAPRFEVSRLDGAAPLAVGFGTSLSSINANTTRVLTTFGTQFQSTPGHARPSLGAPIPSGERLLDPTATTPVASVLHVGVLDQSLHALWRGGYFDLALGGGALNGVIPSGAALTLATALPPTATLRGDGRVEVALGAVNVHLEHPALLAQPVDGNVGGRLSCAGGLEGDDLRLEDCKVDELHLSTGNVLDAPTGAAMQQLMANVLKSVLSIAATDALPGLPILGFPIPAALAPYGLPAGGVFGLVNPTLVSVRSHLIASGGLGIR